jgi:poly(A) polymerase
MSIEDDLYQRDFTINALALGLDDVRRLIDPLHGEDDLRNSMIRMCSPASFTDDPLRLLRGIRLATVLGFTIETGTLNEIRENASLLQQVAAERIRGELMQILETPARAGSLRMLHEAGLLTVILPEVLQESLTESSVVEWIGNVVRLEEVMQNLASCLPDQGQRLAAHLGREIEGGVTAHSLVKLAAFTGSTEYSGNAGAWAKRLSLGRRASRMMAAFGRNLVPVFATLAVNPNRRMLFRYFREFDPAGVELALLALCRGEVTQRMCADLINYFLSDYDPGADDLLLSGDDVMRLLGCGSGPAVGEALERLRTAESRGLVNSSQEAREFLQKNLLTSKEPIS